MTAPLPADFPIRPGFWNVPLWGEIGVYVAAVITIALCAWGVCKNIEVWRRRKDEKLPSDPSRRDRLLKEAVLEEKVRQTSAGRMHAVLVVGFFLLFLGTATATLDWDVGHYVFGKQFLRGNVYLAYKLILDVAGAAVLVALAFAAWRRWGTANELPKDGRFVLAYASLAFIVITGFVIEALRLAVQQPAWMHFSPVGSALAKVFLAMGISTAALETAHIWLWVIHGIAALAFIAAVPPISTECQPLLRYANPLPTAHFQKLRILKNKSTSAFRPSRISLGLTVRSSTPASNAAAAMTFAPLFAQERRSNLEPSC